MSNKFTNILDTIGNTPVVQLQRCVPKNSKHKFWAKLEFFNPGLSVKDRIALAIVEGAEKRGDLKPGGTIVEATSGNTGVGLAMVAAIKGYKSVFVMPEKISEEKRATLRAYGAEVVITPTGLEPDDPNSHYSVARRIASERPGGYFTNQYDNLDNRDAHYKKTGPEIWEQMEGEIDVFIAGVGTGGTVSGVGKYLKEQKPDLKVVVNDPIGSILYDLFYFKEVREPARPYFVEGIGEDMVPECLDFSVIDDFVRVNDKESFEKCVELAREEGLLVGPSSAAALVGAIKYSETLDKPSNILIMFPDNGSKYLTKAFDANWLKTKLDINL
ncbi:MAG: cysteine synthase family protein [Bdellovibrionaceae bacterium]|nr:cysteine synthase family protein [Pseudobdellovibrionaceae bacterium]